MQVFSITRQARILQNTALPNFFLIVGAFMVYELVTNPHDASYIGLNIAWGVLTYFVLRKLLRMPVQITLMEGDTILEFRNIFNKLKFNVSDLKRVEQAGGMIDFVFSTETVDMNSDITGLHELLSQLKKVNNTITTKGC